MTRMNHTPIKQTATCAKPNLKIIMKNITKFEITVMKQVSKEALEIICATWDKETQKNPAVLHNATNYDYDYIIKELTEK